MWPGLSTVYRIGYRNNGYYYSEGKKWNDTSHMRNFRVLMDAWNNIEWNINKCFGGNDGNGSISSIWKMLPKLNLKIPIHLFTHRWRAEIHGSASTPWSILLISCSQWTPLVEPSPDKSYSIWDNKNKWNSTRPLVQKALSGAVTNPYFSFFFLGQRASRWAYSEIRVLVELGSVKYTIEVDGYNKGKLPGYGRYQRVCVWLGFLGFSAGVLRRNLRLVVSKIMTWVCGK